MTQNTNTTTANFEQNVESASLDQVGQDFKNAVLIVSVVANLSVLTAWLTLQIMA